MKTAEGVRKAVKEHTIVGSAICISVNILIVCEIVELQGN